MEPDLASKTPGLGASLRRYWFFLLGTALYPPFAVVAWDVYRVPQDLLIFLFFATCMPALVPWLFLRAPYRFWMVAGAVFMGSGALGGAIVRALRS